MVVIPDKTRALLVGIIVLSLAGRQSIQESDSGRGVAGPIPGSIREWSEPGERTSITGPRSESAMKVNRDAIGGCTHVRTHERGIDRQERFVGQEIFHLEDDRTSLLGYDDWPQISRFAGGLVHVTPELGGTRQ